ncbi:Peptidase_C39 like family protein [Actinacidiphila alni]|uniref:Peptidase_C39 like family protein n=1 Tax=Actinacidiphila alni TaxID=380248 RepID=A0A1I2H519_9ACTN|nr:C39 family peptidase [Actinacidiphila alni]SFF24499.1 Peptidase_C39 like family protein [Actinacidiphila alni]
MTGNEQRLAAAEGRLAAVLHRWDDEAAFAAGQAAGTAWSGGALRLTAPVGRETYADPFGHGSLDWEYGSWTSPWAAMPFAATDIVPSWTADAPDGARITVRLRIRDTGGHESGWYVMGHWSSGDAVVHRATVPGQSDSQGHVDADTFTAVGNGVTACRLQVVLTREAGADVDVALRGVRAVASRPPVGATPAVSGPGGAWGTVLDVPARSQGAHIGHCPQWDGGGEAWAGPACTAMLVEFFGRGPGAADLTWLDPDDPAPQVDFTARQVYDYGYKGCGNWAFNAAYPARYGLRGAVVRLPALTDVERFISAGLPIATTLSFRSSELSGAGQSAAGNIMVVRGFTSSGDVVVNDPLAATDAGVRRVYPRAAFERVWLSGDGGGGVAYLLHPEGTALPPPVPGEPPRW